MELGQQLSVNDKLNGEGFNFGPSSELNKSVYQLSADLALAWGYENERLTKLQKKSVRIITLSKYNAHTEPLFKKLKLLKLTDLLKLNELKFYYKFVKAAVFMGYL